MHYAVSDYIIDLVQNSIEAESSLIVIDYKEDDEKLEVFIADNGKGMDEETLKNALDPFYTDGKKHKERKVGLGLPFVKQMCDSIGGRFEVSSRVEQGTSVYMNIPLDNTDTPPIGNVASLFLELFIFDCINEMVINRYYKGKKYTIIRSEIINALGEVNNVLSIGLLKRYITQMDDGLRY